jgi:hypothetical protein
LIVTPDSTSNAPNRDNTRFGLLADDESDNESSATSTATGDSVPGLEKIPVLGQRRLRINDDNAYRFTMDSGATGLISIPARVQARPQQALLSERLHHEATQQEVRRLGLALVVRLVRAPVADI